ncbi:MAG: hypothetical protein ACLGI6_19650, partial [Gammaproteobacteria bacterium]
DLRWPPGMGPNDVPRDLIAAAHTHLTRIDWVVDKSDWGAFSLSSGPDKQRMLDALADNIVTLLGRRLLTWDPHGTALASLGLDPAPALGEGVSLSFRQFPQQDKQLFNDFVIKLSERLRAMKPARQLNIMAAHHEMTTTQAATLGYANLSYLIDATNKLQPGRPAIDTRRQRMADLRVLVWLAEPTRVTKKMLAEEIQNALVSQEGQRLLRAIVPVIEYDGRSSIQLVNDIVYFVDNYGGIGFWPLPFASDADNVGASAEETVSPLRLLHLYYTPPDDLTALWENYVSYQCPHRLWLRWVWWASLFVAVTVGIIFFSCRGCNERLDSNGLYFAAMTLLMALPFLLLFILTISDPLLNPISGALLLLYIGGGLIGMILLWNHSFKKSRRRIP